MKLDVPIPDHWEVRRVEDGALYQAPSKVFGILVTPLGPAHPDPDLWIHHAFVNRARDDAAEARVLGSAPFRTAAGWSGILLEGEVGSQARLVIYLAFMDYAATVIAMCRMPDLIPTWRDEVLALVAQATPDFTSDAIVCLAHQLGGAPPPAWTEHRERQDIAGWQRTFVGGQLLLSRATAPDAGAIRITADVTPIRPVSALFERFHEPPTIVETDEGEHGVTANTVEAGVQYTLGVAFGDAWYTRIEAEVTAPDLHDTFRRTVYELTYGATLGLGEGRWRRFYYEPPPGWTGIARPGATLWLAPATPRRHQVMRVFDARPPTDHEMLHGMRMFETLPQELFRESPRGPAVYYTADDLECRVFVHTGHVGSCQEPLKVLEGLIVTEPYVYPIRIECEPALLEDSMHVFERVVASVRPVPPRRARTGTASVVAYWAE